MNQDLDKKLCEKHPNIFKDRNSPNPMTFWGFECEDGWYNLIDSACTMIDYHIAHRPIQQEQADKYDIEIKPDIPPFTASQIKEKFGTLRFYYDGGDEVTSAFVAMAEHLSHQTCEKCGNPGKQRSGGWIKTLCDECNNKR